MSCRKITGQVSGEWAEGEKAVLWWQQCLKVRDQERNDDPSCSGSCGHTQQGTVLVS